MRSVEIVMNAISLMSYNKTRDPSAVAEVGEASAAAPALSSHESVF